jgi:hypothetical protein
VDWLLLLDFAHSREEANEIGTSLLRDGHIQHLTDEAHFLDGPQPYIFTQDDPRNDMMGGGGGGSKCR